MIVYELEIPKLYTAIGRSLNKETYRTDQYQYLCCHCRQLFAIRWEKINGNWRGSSFNCPYCGKMHHEREFTAFRKKPIPISVRFTVEVFKTIVKLNAYYQTITFRNLFDAWECPYTETFRFDLAKQNVLHVSSICHVDKSKTIGNPFDESLSERSFLPFIDQRSLAKKQKTELFKMMGILREALQQRQSGSKKRSMFVTHGTERGYMLAPIENMAYRVTYPDAPNLSHEFRADERTRYDFVNRMSLQYGGFELWQDVSKLIRTKRVDFRTALIEATGVVNKKSIRNAVGDNPFGIRLLKLALTQCKNLDLGMRLYRAMIDEKVLTMYSVTAERKVPIYDNLDFLKRIKSWYGEDGMIFAAENYSKLNITDCRHLYNQLNAENCQALVDEKVTLPALHDWLARRHRRQMNPNIKFDVPEHIEKRLAMQKDQMQFFLPKESDELMAIGEKLNNCVASYSKRVKEGKDGIVAMADDKGLLIACIQINDNVVVQAKLKHNRSVRQDPKINAAIVAWAKEAKLKIKTHDIEIPKEKVEKMAMAQAVGE